MARQDYTIIGGTAGATSGALTPDFDARKVFRASGLTGSVSFSAPTSVAQDGRVRAIHIRDDGTSRTITSWDAIYRAIGVTLPTATVAGKEMYLVMMYNAADTKWDVLDLVVQA